MRSAVEDNHHVLHVGAEFLDVLAELLGYLAVTGEQVFAGHTGLAGSATRRDDILGVGEGFLGVGGGCDLYVAETTLAHLLSHTFGREHVVKTDVIGKAHHQGALHHV